jgi:hypothetical protein
MVPEALKTSANSRLSRIVIVAMITSESFQPPLQLKGEVMDLEFAMDADHRKRRRNRTTQSCLNCHTSKRKVGICDFYRCPFTSMPIDNYNQCDRKRPCQRCIQLGLVRVNTITPMTHTKYISPFRQAYASTKSMTPPYGERISCAPQGWWRRIWFISEMTLP